jgi:hypothetical protein
VRQTVWPFLAALLLLAGLWRPAVAERGPWVSLVHTPDGGIQPQALIDSRGVIHLIYMKGDAGKTDIYYVHKKAGASSDFSSPIRVNSTQGSAMATGTIRGAQLALGKDGRPMVAWNGGGNAAKGPGGTPMLFSRLNDAGTAFEPERNLITRFGGLDGGGSVAADGKGNVYVTWHALGGGRTEVDAAIYLARSTDDGKTFAAEKRINPMATGACGCCSMRAFADTHGSVYVLYRSASDGGNNRDTILLTSRDGGRTFQSSAVQPWRINACPMSSFAFVENGGRVFGGWQTTNKVYFSTLPPKSSEFTSESAVTGAACEYPALAANASGRTLFVWAEGCGWMHGGSVAWQMYDAGGKPIGGTGSSPGVPTWSLVSAVAKPDGAFEVYY